MQRVLIDALDRQGHGSQSRLADAIGVRPQTVNKWVRGSTSPEMFRWPAIEIALDLDPGTLASAAGIKPLSAIDDGMVPESIVEMFRRLGDEIALLRAEVRELQNEVQPRRQASDPVPPARRSTS